jgi:hypothetical protein
MTGQEVLIETPKSKLICKPTSKEDKTKIKQTKKEMRNAIAKEKELACNLVFENRLSWRTYEKLKA